MANSSLETFDLNVLYSPSIELVEPSGVVQASVGSSRVLRCRAEGRPAPAYQWLHQQGPGGQVEVVAASRDLELQALGYREAGDYICRVTNTISGEERSAESEVITIQVEGEPQLLGEASVVASTGDTALLEQVLCSDPPATTTTWQWDQVVLGPGGSVDTRYRAELEPHPIMSQCHTSRLLVEGVDRGDSGKYVVRAENERGMDMVTVQLLVQDSLSMVSFPTINTNCALKVSQSCKSLCLQLIQL